MGLCRGKTYGFCWLSIKSFGIPQQTVVDEAQDKGACWARAWSKKVREDLKNPTSSKPKLQSFQAVQFRLYIELFSSYAHPES